MAQDQEIDFRAQGILDGLSKLNILLEEPITRHALDLANNARTAHHYNILSRTHRSLTQYLKLEGDLFYVGLLGHFSTGKSSTINSILNTWNTNDERPTDLNPTDDTISLITRPKNEKNLLGVIREGTVTIRSKPIDNSLLDNIVLVDTPGTGDPALVEEIARDFLPICDVILFFFSAASPLDKNDMPLLEELHRRLPFVPIHFIVTRADELRRDILAPVSEENLDPLKRSRFFDDVLARKRRRILYGAVFSLGIALGALSYLAYVNAVDIPQNDFHAVVWNIVAQLIWAPLAYLFAKGVDKFPKKSATIRHDNQIMLRRALEEALDEEMQAYDFVAIGVPALTKRLNRAYQA